MKLFIFIYFLNDDIERTKQFLGQHIQYWKNHKFEYFRNGPFTDKSGGLIIFSTQGLEEAKEIVAQDPLLMGNAIKQYWLKEWIP
jgi:uncharacterized protein YciI